MLRLLFAAMLVFGWSPALAGENCTCRYKENDVNEGQTICMQTPNGSQMATCARVLNNTSWKFLGTPCPLAQNKSVPKNLNVFEPENVEALIYASNKAS